MSVITMPVLPVPVLPMPVVPMPLTPKPLARIDAGRTPPDVAAVGAPCTAIRHPRFDPRKGQ